MPSENCISEYYNIESRLFLPRMADNRSASVGESVCCEINIQGRQKIVGGKNSNP
jgi:hypothetical protein